jgi:hypothetical protein
MGERAGKKDQTKLFATSHCRKIHSDLEEDKRKIGEIMTMIMIIIISTLVLLLGVSVYFSIKFGMTILRVQDALEESLDILDERYESVNKILDIPLYSDSPEIRKVHDDIRTTRDSILYIANIMVGVDVETFLEPQEETNIES